MTSQQQSNHRKVQGLCHKQVRYWHQFQELHLDLGKTYRQNQIATAKCLLLAEPVGQQLLDALLLLLPRLYHKSQ
jgi:hypothetical protein